MTCGSVAVYFSGLRSCWKKRHLEATPLSSFSVHYKFPLFPPRAETLHWAGGRGGGGEGPAFLAPRDGKGGGRRPPELLRRGGAKRGGAEAGDTMLLVYRKLRDMGK